MGHVQDLKVISYVEFFTDTDILETLRGAVILSLPGKG